MEKYDFIIAGAGCAGLSLVYQLLESPLQNSRILLIDKNLKNSNDRTWSFWTDQSTVFDQIVSKEWKKVEVRDEKKRLILPLTKLSYKTIRGIDFYDTVRTKIAQFPNVDWLHANIENISQTAQGAEVRADGQKYTAKWVFDSLFRPADFSVTAQNYHYLIQHFQGYVIKTPKPAFDPQTVTMFDFRAEQIDGVHFFYILPISETEGLVEFTVFSKELLPKETYQEKLRNYLAEKLQTTAYEILETEWGIIPMTDFRFERHPFPNVMRIGTNGGISRGSTGYTFLRIQKDTEKIIDSLLRFQTPFYETTSAWQFETMDTVILNIMQQKGETVAWLFMEMFANNPVERVLRFLENRTTSLENLQIMASVPPFPFLEAIGRIVFKKLSNFIKSVKP